MGASAGEPFLQCGDQSRSFAARFLIGAGEPISGSSTSGKLGDLELRSAALVKPRGEVMRPVETRLDALGARVDTAPFLVDVAPTANAMRAVQALAIRDEHVTVSYADIWASQFEFALGPDEPVVAQIVDHSVDW